MGSHEVVHAKRPSGTVSGGQGGLGAIEATQSRPRRGGVPGDTAAGEGYSGVYADVRKEGREYQQEWAQGVPLLVRRGLSVVQEKKLGERGRMAVYDVATEHGQMVVINCHGQHGRRVKRYVAQLGMEYVRAPERGPVIMVGDFNYDPRRRGAETEVDQEVQLFVEEMRLQDVS